MSDAQRIVVLNDDPVQLRLLRRILESEGHDVDAYRDASEALDTLATIPPVDLFVVDLHMPGIDGWKVCRLLRSAELSAYNGTPILIVSATFTGTDVEAITRDLGADGFLALPYTREELLTHVSELLKGQRPKVRQRALVVEDNDDVARVIQKAFETNGYEVTRLSNVVEASAEWTARPPDVVILDYHLPDGSSLELISSLQTAADPTVVIFMTGDSHPSLPVSLLKAGADAFVRKPFDPAFLVELAGKARRERSLLRVEALLESRTRQLRSSELRYRTLFAAIPDMVVALDASGRVTSANDAAVQALVGDGQTLLGLELSEFVEHEERAALLERLDETRRRGRIRREATFLTPAGAMDVEITATAVEDARDGAVLLVARDVSERRRAEQERRKLDQQVQHAQRLESLGVLAGGIAHDFNNLLVGVMGNASLALLDVDPDTSLHECVTQIETAARRAAELTQQILTFSGKGDSATSPEDLSVVVREMGRLLGPAVSTKADLRYRLTTDLPEIEVDASQVRQVVMNLIMNASDALAGQSGVIEVSTSLEQLDARDKSRHYLGGTARPGPYVALSVRDEGCGMDEATLRQIFDPFFTTKFAGRGLGLAATLGIMKAHHGLVFVDSKLGMGTTFQVLFPVGGPESETDATRAADGEPVASPEADGRRTVILVVDSEPTVRQLVNTSLSRAGYEVREAASVDDALRALEGGDRPALVVADPTMPVPGGSDLYEELRSRCPRIPLVLSATLGAGDPRGRETDDATAYVPKPYTPSKLLSSVQRLLRAVPAKDPCTVG